jgi:hypothetical protein
LLIVSSDTAPDHFVSEFGARHDERGETATTEAKPAKGNHNNELQELITHRSNSGSFAILAALRRAS